MVPGLHRPRAQEHRIRQPKAPMTKSRIDNKARRYHSVPDRTQEKGAGSRHGEDKDSPSEKLTPTVQSMSPEKSQLAPVASVTDLDIQNLIPKRLCLKQLRGSFTSEASSAVRCALLSHAVETTCRSWSKPSSETRRSGETASSLAGCSISCRGICAAVHCTLCVRSGFGRALSGPQIRLVEEWWKRGPSSLSKSHDRKTCRDTRALGISQGVRPE